MFPKNFDPARSWPILIVTSTTDLDRTSIMDAPWYRDAAMVEGWVVLATDATIRPRTDSVLWRLAMLTAGLQMIRTIGRNRPVGRQRLPDFRWCEEQRISRRDAGKKTVGLKSVDFFLAGMNADRLSAAYHDYQPPAAFLSIPVWLAAARQIKLRGRSGGRSILFFETHRVSASPPGTFLRRS